ncbi:unnamed protein product [Amoebophrya sp. A25]|nr:unnamed protein product [Amoebophrya sp. A25]|eukprot:GSA25T00009800001.1
MSSCSTKRPILISLPTNNCARILLFLKLFGFDEPVDVKSPKDFGGLKSPEYLKINPQGKFPALILEDGSTWFESQVILELLADKFLRASAPAKYDDFRGGLTVEGRAHVNLLIRVHDLYLASANCSQPGYFATQASLYKADMTLKDRSARAVDLVKQLDVLENLFQAAPANLPALTMADLVLYPTFLFLVPLTSETLNWPREAVWAGRPSLRAWFDRFEKMTPALSPVCDAVRGFVQSAFVDSGRLAAIKGQVLSEDGQQLSWGVDNSSTS